MKIDKQTGMVTVIDKKTGKVKRLHPIDAREQMAFPLEQRAIRYPDEEERKEVDGPTFDYSGVDLANLRDIAQGQGIAFHGRPRTVIAYELNEKKYMPTAEELADK